MLVIYIYSCQTAQLENIMAMEETPVTLPENIFMTISIYQSNLQDALTHWNAEKAYDDLNTRDDHEGPICPILDEPVICAES